jgi:hypothetical protein
MEAEGASRSPGRQKRKADPPDLERGEGVVVHEDLDLETVEDEEEEEEEEEEGTENPGVCADLLLLPLEIC